MKYRKPSFYDVFKHVLENVGKKDVPIKKDEKNGEITYKTAVSFKDTVQKVYFDTSKEIIKFTSMHGHEEKVDYEIKAEWLENGKVTFKQVQSHL